MAEPFLEVAVPKDTFNEWPPEGAQWVGGFGDGSDTNVGDFRVVASIYGKDISFKLYPIEAK